MSSALDAFIGKMDPTARKDLSELHGTCWDEDDVMLKCRNCNVEFSMRQRKHHCRSCGGIYCDSCNPLGGVLLMAASASHATSDTPSSPVAKDEGFWFGKYVGRPNPKLSKESALPPQRSSEDISRYCIGCRMAEAPCQRVKTILKDRYVSVMASRSAPRPPSEQLQLVKGSLYGEATKVMQRRDGKEAHTSGYIEILNKGDFAFCVKMFTTQSDIYRESSRPSYLAVLPEEVVYVEVDPSVAAVDVAILYGNKNRVPPGEPIVRNVREYLDANPDHTPNSSVVSQCCLVENFNMVALYTIDVDGRNAILKYQGQGVLEIRKGTTSNFARGTERVLKGVIGSVARAHKGTLDMATNTENLTEVFRCNAFPL